jgi:hypothetical protein
MGSIQVSFPPIQKAEKVQSSLMAQIVPRCQRYLGARWCGIEYGREIALVLEGAGVALEKVLER